LLVRVALAASFATMLSACGIARTVNGGIYAMPTTGDRIPVGGLVSGQIAFGNRLFVGLDATGRVTGDYMHGALGGHLSFFSQASPGPYGRVGFAPLAVSANDSNVWYAINTSLELGTEFPFGDRTHTVGFLTTHDKGTAWTLGVRGDLEYRPAQAQSDVFLSLVVGYHSYDLGGN
jgi:hypothetical protein